jgi:diguanylate cyclase (GGDEF)-like protein
VSALGWPFDIDRRPVTISCSVGVATSTGGPDTVERLIHAADEAMYAAKAAGTNRWSTAVTEPAGRAR